MSFRILNGNGPILSSAQHVISEEGVDEVDEMDEKEGFEESNPLSGSNGGWIFASLGESPAILSITR